MDGGELVVGPRHVGQGGYDGLELGIVPIGYLKGGDESIKEICLEIVLFSVLK